MNDWIPYISDVVSQSEINLWSLCVKPDLDWNDICEIEKLLNNGANPFIRDICGNYLSTVVFFGFWWTTHCSLSHINVNIARIGDGHSHPQTKHKIYLDYTEITYQKYVLAMLKKSMYDRAYSFDKIFRQGSFHWAKIIPEFMISAKEFLLVNKRLNSKKNVCTYGLFPREIVIIILQNVAANVVFGILNNTKNSLKSFTIDNIYKIGTVASNVKGVCGKVDISNLQKLKRKRPRKCELIDEVDLICSSTKKYESEFEYECSKLPYVVGTIIATDNLDTNMMLTYNIPNPKTKPFVMVGRSFDKKREGLYLDNVDMDMKGFQNSSRISRNNMKVRFNPITSKIEVLLIGRNGLGIKRNNEYVAIDKSWWVPIEPGDIIIQENTQIQYSFITYQE